MLELEGAGYVHTTSTSAIYAVLAMNSSLDPLISFAMLRVTYDGGAPHGSIHRHPVHPAIKRPIRSAALDVGVEVSTHGIRSHERVHRALANLAIMIVSALEQDDHVLSPAS